MASVASKFTFTLKGSNLKPKSFHGKLSTSWKVPWKVINFHKSVLAVIKKKKMKSGEKISGGR